MMKTSGEIGYVELICGNANLRRIWLADIASMLGDWFNTIALYTVVESLTGSPLALGGVFITKMLSFALASPVAGLLSDRFDRRRLMITCDLSRAVLVLGFLFVDEPGDVVLLYTLAALQMAVGAAFLPARNASVPKITSARELVTANTLMAITWSALLAIGAALGGVVNAWLGTRAVFLIDSVTYLISAQLLWHTVIPPRVVDPEGRPVSDPEGRPVSRSLFGEAAHGILSGWRYILAHPHIGRMILVKTSWAVGGSGLVYMLALLGKHLSPESSSIGIGLLYAARGVGTGVGPIIARVWIPSPRRWPLFFGLGMCLTALMYGAVGYLPWNWWILPLVLVGHTASGANWTFSNVLLQERSSDRYRGRVFSTDLLLLTLIDSVMILLAGLLLDWGILELRSGFQVFAAIQLACGVLWITLVVPWERAWAREVA